MKVNVIHYLREDLDDATKLELVVNAIFFKDDQYLIDLTKKNFATISDLPNKQSIITQLVSDKLISNDEAELLYNEFISKYYGGESNES